MCWCVGSATQQKMSTLFKRRVDVFNLFITSTCFLTFHYTWSVDERKCKARESRSNVPCCLHWTSVRSSSIFLDFQFDGRASSVRVRVQPLLIGLFGVFFSCRNERCIKSWCYVGCLWCWYCVETNDGFYLRLDWVYYYRKVCDWIWESKMYPIRGGYILSNVNGWNRMFSYDQAGDTGGTSLHLPYDFMHASHLP